MYTLTRIHPFPDPIREMERAIFGRPFGGFFTEDQPSLFRTDIRDMGENYLLFADLPGFRKEDIRLEVTEALLTIRAERKAEEEDNNFIRRERSCGSYSRSFRMKDIDTERITAKYENGVLTVTLPKRQEEIPATRQVTIE